MFSDPEQNTHTQSQSLGEGTGVSSNLSSASLHETFVANGDENCARCLEERRRADAILDDLQNLQTDVIGKNRIIGKLKAELAQQREESPEGQQLKNLLNYAKETLGKTKRWYIGLDGDRAKLAKKVLVRYGEERCKKAVRGLAAKPYAGPRGRSAEQYPGSKRWDDLDYCWGTDKRFTDCEQIAEELEHPTLEAVPDLPPKKPRRDGPVVKRIKSVEAGDAPPIDTVLHNLTMRDCDWRAGADPDRWRAQCPGHMGDGYSLAIQRNADGMVLVHCHVGCTFEEVLDGLGLEPRDLWANCENDHQAVNYRSPKEREASLPPHLKQAMRQLLARSEREAA